MSTNPQRIVITGGASGLGKALALRWAKTGAKVCIADINDERGEETLTAIKKAGGSGLYVHADMTSDDDIRDLRDQVLGTFQGVDILINNAGIATAGAVVDEPVAQWQLVLDVNLLGIVRCNQAFLPTMQEQGCGYIVNIASQAGITPIPLMSSYNAVKAAVVGYSETMHLELADDGINVSVACPSFFRTNLGESMQSSQAGMNDLLEHLFSNAKVTADDVAQTIYQAVQKQQFMVLSHKEGKLVYRLKNTLPWSSYLKLMRKQTQRIVRKLRAKSEKPGKTA